DDGRIGGTGRMDGGRTMLVPEGGHHVMVRYRFANSATFGGDLERIEIYRDEAGGKAKLIKVQRNTGPAQVLEPQGVLDTHGAGDAGGWHQATLTAALAKPVA